MFPRPESNKELLDYSVSESKKQQILPQNVQELTERENTSTWGHKHIYTEPAYDLAFNLDFWCNFESSPQKLDGFSFHWSFLSCFDLSQLHTVDQ